MKNILVRERELMAYALNGFSRQKDLELYGSRRSKDRLGVFSFNLKGLHSHDVADILSRDNVCVRAGHHCAQPLHDSLGINSSVRASLYLYNTKDDIDRLFAGLKKVWRTLKP